MKRSKALKLVSLACAATLSMTALAGCAAEQDNEEQQAQAQNRQYMTQVNQTLDTLDEQLDGFVDAVSRGDLVTMRTQADNAFKTLDDLESTEAPEALSEVKADYIEGCNSLKEALNGYVQLYTDIESATDAQPFDYGTYDQRLQEIQEAYNQGIEKLRQGDESATNLP